jgi:hypothetical protein
MQEFGARAVRVLCTRRPLQFRHRVTPTAEHSKILRFFAKK